MENNSEYCISLQIFIYKTWKCLTCRSREKSKGISIVSNFDMDERENNKKKFTGVASRHPNFHYREYGDNNV